MKKLLYLFLFSLSIVACDNDDDCCSPPPVEEEGYFAVANRGSGTVTIFDAETQSLSQTITLPDGAVPTYVVQSPKLNTLFVSDLDAMKVWVYDSEDFSYKTAYDIQDGGFHMWNHDDIGQVWVTNIRSKTTSVLNNATGATLATLSLPSDKVTFAADATVHDVFIAPNGQYAFVSVLSGGQNYVLQYRTDTFEFVKAQEVGFDPHISGSESNLFVLSEGEGNIVEYTYDTFEPTGEMQLIPNAHGVTYAGEDQFYVTNFSGRKVVSYNSSNNQIVSEADASADAGVAHNLAYATTNGVVALTISGGQTVEFFSTNENGDLTNLSSIASGMNPFGIWYFNK